MRPVYGVFSGRPASLLPLMSLPDVVLFLHATPPLPVASPDSGGARTAGVVGTGVWSQPRHARLWTWGASPTALSRTLPICKCRGLDEIIS